MKQVGKNCIKDSKDYYKLQKKSDRFGFNTFLNMEMIMKSLVTQNLKINIL